MPRERGTRVLTFLIADVRGYTSYTQAHGDEAAARLAATFAEIAREGVEARGGEVIELRGDEALAVFGSSPDALRAAVDLQLVFADEVELHPDLPLRVGIGVDAGAAVPVEGGYRGGALNLAARLCSKAGPGEVLASRAVVGGGAVEGLRFHDHGEFEMKGLSEPVRVSRVSPQDLDPDVLAARFTHDGRTSPTATDVPRALDTATPIVGREREIHRLRWAWRKARRSEGAMIPVVGPAGIGKTRLLAEVAASASHDGASITYVSLRERLDPATLDRALAVDEPALVMLDDAEAWTEELGSLETLSARVAGTNALVVVAMDESSLPPDLHTTVQAADGAAVRPGPLDLDDIREIAGSYIGASADALPASLLESTGGVPRRIHRQVSEWALAEANRRLGAAASRAATGRSDLRSVESELAGNVVDLQHIRERARLFADVDRRTDEPEGSPFKGLASFDVGDADLFFGRERLVAEFVARLAGASLLGVVGPSGSGKSSAVRAGLIPAIRSGVLPGSEEWSVALVRPGEHPMGELDRALTDRAAERHLLLVVDQFEEVFTLCPDEEEQARFLAALAETANSPEDEVTIVVAVRADLYGRCADEPALAELLGANHVLVGPMTPDEYRRAIEQPAIRVGVHVESALTEALVDEVGDEPGALPLLSTALLELWGRRDGRAIRLDAYLRTGGVRGAVARLAEDVYGGLGAEQQAISRAVMLRLAAPGEGNAVVRRRVPLAEFDAERNQDVADVVKVLTDRRLLTVSEGVVEVAHEALLREWPRLRSWLEEDRAGRVLHAHLMDTARLWEIADRDQGELYRGARLASAIDWTTDHTLELNELEREFLNASRDANEREADRQRRSNRRLRGLLVGVALFLALALVAGGVALVQRGKAETAATEATARRLGAQAVIEDELDLSLLLARQGYEIDDSDDTRSTLLASLLKAPGAIGVLSGTGNRVLSIEASADGRVFATTDNTGGVAIYNAERLALERIVWFPEQYHFDISPDGGTLAGSTFESGGLEIVALVDTATGEKRRLPLPVGTGFAAFGVTTAFDPDGSSFVTIECRPCEEGYRLVLVRRDAIDGSERSVSELPMVDFEVDRIEFSGDGRTLAVIGFDADGARALFLDAASLDVEHELRRDDLHSSALSDDGDTLAVGGGDGSVTLIDLPSGKERALQGRHDAIVQGVAFSPDGETLVSTGDDAAVNVWDIGTGSLREILHGHAGRVTTAPVFDAEGSTAYTIGLDGNVIAWDLDGARRIGRALPIGDGGALFAIAEDGPPPSYDFVAAAPANGAVVATSTSDGSIEGVDPETGRVLWEVDPWSEEQLERMRSDDPASAGALTGWITEMAFDPEGEVLAVAGENPEVVLYEGSTGRELSRWRASRLGWVNGVSVAPDGSVVTSNDDGRVVLWDPSTQRARDEYRFLDEAADLNEWTGAPFRAIVNPDGTRLAVAVYYRGTRPMDVAVVDLSSGERSWTRPADENMTIVAWSPDSDTLALGGWQNGALTLRDAATGRRLHEPVTANEGFVNSVAFTPDGSMIVTGGTDGTVRLWDSATLKQIGSNLPHDENIGTSAWVVRDDEIEVVSSNGKLFRWDLDPQRWAEQACLVANRTLTRSEWRSVLPDLPYDPACER